MLSAEIRLDAVRIATWNVNSVTARLPRLLDWLGTTDPDIVCLQEVKTSVAAFPSEQVAELGYESAVHGTGRWNGVAILSRVGLDDVRLGLLDEPGFQPEDAMLEVTEPRAMAATCAGIRVWSIYAPNGREVGHPHFDYKPQWFDALRSTIEDERRDRFVLMGDFNVAPTDDDVWDPRAAHGGTHVSTEERAALQRLRDEGLTDVVPRALKHGTPYTYWDYRAGMFHKNMGMRIDLVYASQAIAEAVTDAYVDREARKGTGPSDHAPVVVDLAL
jgi:exodeoxyribonuclease-3